MVRVVFDDEDQLALETLLVVTGAGIRVGGKRQRCGSRCLADRQRDREHTAASGPGAQFERMAEQVGGAAHDSKAEPQSFVAVTFRVAQLAELEKDALVL